MHSHDRTLLARLGFADPDKKDPRHDYACQYLALPENAERLVRMLAHDAARAKPAKLEHPIPSGYTTVGFLDLVVPYTYIRKNSAGGEWERQSALMGEIKAGKCSISELLRQMEFYRRHERPLEEQFEAGERWSSHPLRWFVAAPWLISKSDEVSLKAQGVAYIRLGPKFDAYVASRKLEAPAESEEF